jgi:branched-chain amino acid transport system ATP-binding protein
MNKSLLNITGLVKHFGGLCVTDKVDLSISKGEIHAVIGPNGAGKTTLINQIVGEIKPDAGHIYLGDEEATHWPVARRARAGIGRSYQINSLIPHFSVLENVLLATQAAGGHNFYFFKPATHVTHLVEQAQACLVSVNLIAEQNRVAGALSYGQQRLVEIAMALATRPKLLLLDEPMAGLGPTETERMVELLITLQHQYATLLVEHDMGAVFALATQVSVLVYGKILMCDTPHAVRNSDVVREAYLGDEEIDA